MGTKEEKKVKCEIAPKFNQTKVAVSQQGNAREHTQKKCILESRIVHVCNVLQNFQNAANAETGAAHGTAGGTADNKLKHIHEKKEKNNNREIKEIISQNNTCD